jgi:hypothetical protein
VQVEFRSHFSGKKVRLMGWEIRYLKNFFLCILQANWLTLPLHKTCSDSSQFAKQVVAWLWRDKNLLCFVQWHLLYIVVWFCRISNSGQWIQQAYMNSSFVSHRFEVSAVFHLNKFQAWYWLFCVPTVFSLFLHRNYK